MRAQLGTQVRSQDDKTLGAVEWVLVDPETKIVKSIGVRHGLIREHTFRIPLSEIHVSASLDHLIADVSEETVKHLAHPAQPHTESMPDGAAVAASTPGSVWPPDTFAIKRPGAPTAQSHDETVQFIEADVIVLGNGSDVYTKDVHHIGEIEQMRFETRTGQILSFVVKRGIFHHQEFDLEGELIAGVDAGAVYLSIDHDALKQLIHGSV